MKKEIQNISFSPDIGGCTTVTVFFADFTKLAVSVPTPAPGARVTGGDVLRSLGDMVGCRCILEGTFTDAFVAAFDKHTNP